MCGWGLSCSELVSFFGPGSHKISDGNPQINMRAMEALAQIALWADGAQAIVTAKATDRILELLESPSPNVQSWTCELVGRLASHESTAPAILELKPCVQLVSLLR